MKPRLLTRLFRFPIPPRPYRRLAHTIRTSRWLNLLTWHSKPHPKLRFTSLTPKPLGGAAAAGAAPAVDAGAAKAGEAVKIGSAL